MRKDTPKMWTSSQTIMNLTETILEVNYYDHKIKSFKGIINKLPKGYTPKIKIIIITPIQIWTLSITHTI